MKKSLTIIAFSISGLVSFAQQDAQFSMNMFNRLAVNPGYAGTNKALCATILYRDQWDKFPGAPKTGLLSVDYGQIAHGGVGFTIDQDQLGFDKTLKAKLAYSYHLLLGTGTLGIGLDVEEPIGNMIIDIGGGTTEIAVIALSGIVCDQSIRIAGDELTNDIVNYMKRQHNILIGERTAEQIKIHVGSALPELEAPPDDFAVNGRDLMTGIPKQVTVSYSEVSHCLDKSISKIEDAILKALETTPPELAADIYKTGLYLTGGGALLRGLDKRIAAKTKLPVHVANDPLRAVVRGTGLALKNTHKYTFLIDRKRV